MTLAPQAWGRRPLGELVDIVSSQVDPRRPPYLTMPHVGGDNITSHSGALVNIRPAEELGLTSGKYLFDASHVLYSKIRPNLNKVVAPDFAGTCSADIYALRPRTDLVTREYLVHLLRSPAFLKFAATRSSRTNIPKLNREALLAYGASVPPLADQRRIAAILDKSAAIRRKREASLRLVDDFLRAAFLDLFGDPVRNPKGWPVKRLGEVAAIRGGLQVTAARSPLPIEVPYLRVANVHREALDLCEIKAIRVTPAELERTRLAAGDLLVVEGHGNPAEIGRVAIWDGSINPCVHQNHLIRVTLDLSVVESSYASAYLNSPGGRRHLLRAGKTTSGLNTISTSDVSRTRMPVPPILLQRRFTAVRSAASRAGRRINDAQQAQSALAAVLAAQLLGNG